MKAAFLDRDGIINIERGDYTYTLDQFSFTNHFEILAKKLIENGFELIVITNQGGIDKGIYSKREVESLHRWMIEELKKKDILVKEIYYCPHHNSIQNCICRKPNSQLIEKAIARFNIDASNSMMIGDKERDVLAGEKAGVKGILIPSNPDWAIEWKKILPNG